MNKTKKQQQLNHPCMLPNLDGFEFYGYGHDGGVKKLYIRCCPVTGMHHVEGGYRYSDLVGWSVKKLAPDEYSISP
jgi:hypothetical protein